MADLTLSVDADGMALFHKMRNLLNLARLDVERMNDYYEGDHRIRQLGLALPPELLSFGVFLYWPMVAVDGLEERLDVTGFRFPGKTADPGLWETWQYNDLDEQQTSAHVDALALSRSYVCVSTNPDDAEHPFVTVESPREMITLRDPRTRRAIAGLRMYSDQPSSGFMLAQPDTLATLYLPDSTHWLKLDNGSWVDTADPDEHRLGVPPIASMVNRNRRTLRRNAFVEGVSEMAPVIPLAESASRALTNAQFAQETHAVPHRVLAGAKKTDFVDQSGAPTGAFDAYMSAITMLANPAAKAMQFDATDMSNWETMLNVYARAASGVAQMPIEYFGLNTQNPPSADGQRAGETRLIKKAERRQVSFGHTWEMAQRLVLRFRDGEWDPSARGLETMWRDAGTPTKAQATDSVTKLHTAGLVDWETAQEDLGRTPAQIAQMKLRRAADMQLALTSGLQDALIDDAAPPEQNPSGEPGAA